MGFQGDSAQSGNKYKSWQELFVRPTVDRPSVIQIVEPEAKNFYWQHWLPMIRTKSGKRGSPIVCPGMDVCPVCQRNKEVGRESPDYMRTSKRWYVNVLDLTPRKECPLCEETTYGSDECFYCGTSLAEVPTAGPTVRLLERGVELFTQLNTIEETVTRPYDPNDPVFDHAGIDYSEYSPGEEAPIGWTRYPIKLVVSKQTNKPVPVAGDVNDINWQEYVDEYVTFEEAYIHDLTPDEIKELLGSGSLSEVLKARHETTESGQEEITF